MFDTIDVISIKASRKMINLRWLLILLASIGCIVASREVCFKLSVCRCMLIVAESDSQICNRIIETYFLNFQFVHYAYFMTYL